MCRLGRAKLGESAVGRFETELGKVENGGQEGDASEEEEVEGAQAVVF